MTAILKSIRRFMLRRYLRRLDVAIGRMRTPYSRAVTLQYRAELVKSIESI
jgi:hypothetical protein